MSKRIVGLVLTFLVGLSAEFPELGPWVEWVKGNEGLLVTLIGGVTLAAHFLGEHLKTKASDILNP